MINMMQEVVEFCKSYLIVNSEAFCDPRLELIINDARFIHNINMFYINYIFHNYQL